MARQKQAPTDPKAFIKEYRDGFNSNNKRPRLEDPEDNTHRAADRQYAASRATDQYTPDYEQVVLEDLTAEEQLKKLKEHLKEAKDRNLDLRARSKMVLENEVNIVRESEQEIDKLKNDLKECQQENNQVKNSTKEDQNKITLLEGLAKDHEAAGLQGVAQEKAKADDLNVQLFHEMMARDDAIHIQKILEQKGTRTSNTIAVQRKIIERLENVISEQNALAILGHDLHPPNNLPLRQANMPTLQPVGTILTHSITSSAVQTNMPTQPRYGYTRPLSTDNGMYVNTSAERASGSMAPRPVQSGSSEVCENWAARQADGRQLPQNLRARNEGYDFDMPAPTGSLGGVMRPKHLLFK